MFAERFDALVNIAEVTNSLLGREVNMNPSHIGRLRSGARPLPKKHEFLPAMCEYLATHIQKDYQIIALQKLTGISSAALASSETTAAYLEQWLLEKEQDTSVAAARLISGFSRLAPRSAPASVEGVGVDAPQKYATYLYGNAGKRKAVEQFFLLVLQEEAPQTLLLFSDENLTWLYEDAAFAARWAELFIKIIAKGNRVKIIHTVSRDMNEMLEAVTKWIPLYMTGAIEPYCYPRLRDGLFQRTMFIAPKTAAIISSSVQQDTDGMLNLFLTDRAAIDALCLEYERYFSLCRPLMRIFNEQHSDKIQRSVENLATAEGNAYLCCATPPIFTIPKKMISELAEQTGNNALVSQWKQSVKIFQKHIKDNRLSIVLLDPELALFTPDKLCLPMAEMIGIPGFTYTKEQYMANIEWLRQMETRYENLSVDFSTKITNNTILYVKEDVGVFIARTDAPITAFAISDRNMTNAVWDCMEKKLLF